MAPTRAPFPDDPETFKDDDRIAWSNVDNTYLLQDEGGEEWEWRESVRKWISSSYADEDIEKFKASYADGSVVEEETVFDRKKRKAEREELIAAQKKQEQDAKQEVAPNTAIYVTGLPLNIDNRDLEVAFGKYGLIAESVDSNKKRVIMYYDDQNKFKGEALIIYFKPQSVQLAIMMADETDFRTGVSGGTMRVQEASNTFKEHKGSASTFNSANQRPIAPAKGTKGSKSNKGTNNRAAQKYEEMSRRIGDWDGSDDSDVGTQIRSNEPEGGKIVVIAKAFTLEDLDAAEDRDLEKQEIAQDIEDRAKLYGKVVAVTVMDKERRGIVTVEFAEEGAASKCVVGLSGRVFDGRRLAAWVQDGAEVWAQTKSASEQQPKKKAKRAENDAEDEEKRLKEYSAFLDGDE